MSKSIIIACNHTENQKSEIKSSWIFYPKTAQAIALQWAGVINNS